MIVNELVTKFRFKPGNSFKKFDAKLKQTAKNADKQTRHIKKKFAGIGKSVTKLKKNLKMKLKIRGANEAKKTLASLRSLAGSVKSSLKTVAIGAGVSSVAAFGAALYKVGKVGIETENLMARLSTVRGPEQAIRDFKVLGKFAESTPFQLNEIGGLFSDLSAVQMDLGTEEMRAFGNIAAASGKPLGEFGEMVKGLLKGQTAMVDNFAGSNGLLPTLKDGNIILNATSKNGKKMTATLNKTASLKEKGEIIRKFMLELGKSDGVAGSMERLSKTLGGLLSTLADNIDSVARELYQGGIGELFKDLAEKSTDLAKSMKPMARQLGIFVKLRLPAVLDGINKGFSKMKPLLKPAAFLLGIFVSHWVGLKALAIADMLVRAAGALKGFVAVLKTMQGLKFLSLLAASPAVIGGVILAIGLLAYDVYKFFTTGESYLLSFTEKWPQLQAGIKTVYWALIDFGSYLWALGEIVVWFAIGTVKNFLVIRQGLIDLMIAIGAAWWNGLVMMYNGAISFKNWIVNTLINLAVSWGEMVRVAIAFWADLAANVISKGAELTNSVMGGLDRIKQFFTNIGTWASSGFSSALKSARSFVKNLPVIGNIFGGGAGPVKRNRGGFIPGSGNTDSVPAVLTPGEFVINKGLVQDILSGNPRGLGALRKQMSAPTPAAVGSGMGVNSNSVGGYSIPSSSIATNNYNITINAPLHQTNNISGAGGSANDIGNKIGTSASARFNQGLSNAARQVPQRIGRA